MVDYGPASAFCRMWRLRLFSVWNASFCSCWPSIALASFSSVCQTVLQLEHSSSVCSCVPCWQCTLMDLCLLDYSIGLHDLKLVVEVEG